MSSPGMPLKAIMICSCGHLRAKVGHELQLAHFHAIQRGFETCI